MNHGKGEGGPMSLEGEDDMQPHELSHGTGRMANVSSISSETCDEGDDYDL